MTLETRAPVTSTAQQVADEARRAWELTGDQVQTGSRTVNGHARMATLAAMQAKRFEYVIDGDDPDIWTTLAHAASAELEHWQRCALVPLSLMGRAHERLSPHGFQLQSWWVTDGRVSFGNVEIA